MSDFELELRERKLNNLDFSSRFSVALSSSLRREAKPLPKLRDLVDLVDVLGLVTVFAGAILGLNALAG